MKHFTKLLVLCMTLFVGCSFTLPAQVIALDNHASATATKVKISKTKVAITEGKTVQLKVTGTKKKIKWSTSKKSVATVTTKGKVTGKKAGTATITAKVGKKALKCKVTVKKKPTPEPSPGADYVWIPQHGGTKYHSTETCSNMDGPRQVTLQEAESLGFTRCSRCW